MGEILLLGTKNRHKTVELAELLDGLPWEVRSLEGFRDVAAPDEDADTFSDNALLKARYYSREYGVTCVADDSGLVVDALDGAPGVLSARYAGEHGGDDANNAKLLAELNGVESALRTARFVCCAAIAHKDGRTHVEMGTVEGLVAHECRGPNGFGYDPLFVPDGYARTFGELDPAIKMGISHRARAFGKLRDYLETLL